METSNSLALAVQMHETFHLRALLDSAVIEVESLRKEIQGLRQEVNISVEKLQNACDHALMISKYEKKEDIPSKVKKVRKVKPKQKKAEGVESATSLNAANAMVPVAPITPPEESSGLMSMALVRTAGTTVAHGLDLTSGPPPRVESTSVIDFEETQQSIAQHDVREDWHKTQSSQRPATQSQSQSQSQSQPFSIGQGWFSETGRAKRQIWLEDVE